MKSFVSFGISSTETAASAAEPDGEEDNGKHAYDDGDDDSDLGTSGEFLPEVFGGLEVVGCVGGGGAGA